MSGKPPWTTTEIVLCVIFGIVFFGCFSLLMINL